MTRKVDQIIETLVKAGKELDKTPAQVAFAWILDHPEITAAITGPDKPEHVEEVCGSLCWALPTEVREQLDAVSTTE
jgi:aryl-alcohol dehydrogenase-like predicted oxidoreductase